MSLHRSTDVAVPMTPAPHRVWVNPPSKEGMGGWVNYTDLEVVQGDTIAALEARIQELEARP